MRSANHFGVAALLALAIAVSASLRAGAAEPPANPFTLWNFLGIPQGVQKLRDATVNPRGKHPQWERKPALKRIADPANLKSDNPAIQAAAQAKADADLAPQKIKAIKYLATIACCCPTNKDQIKNALLAALDDCTEDVRYEAAVAICQAAGNPCTVCNRCSCCAADVMNKLAEMADGQDAQGCPVESSPRVQAAARSALDACRRVRGPTTAAPPEEIKERRIEEPPKENILTPTPEQTTKGRQSILPQEDQMQLAAMPAGFSRPDKSSTGDDFSLEGKTSQPSQPADGSNGWEEKLYVAGRFPLGRKAWPEAGRVCPEGQTGSLTLPERCPAPCLVPEPEEARPGEARPGEERPGEVPPEERAAPAPGGLASAMGGAAGPAGAVPNMIGDAIGGGSSSSVVVVDKMRFGANSSLINTGTFDVMSIPPPNSPVTINKTLTPPVTVEGVTFANTVTLQTAVDRATVDQRLTQDPTQSIPVNEPNANWKTSANQVFVNRHGPANPNTTQTRFADTSDATVTDLSGQPKTPGPLVTYDRFAPNFDYEYVTVINVPSPSAGKTVKIAENTNPLPQDRVLLNYSFFNNVPLFANGVDVSRFEPGFEKTFADGWISLEVKVPMFITLDSTIIDTGNGTGTDLSHGEFGNLSLTYKELLFRSERFALSCGLQLALPTADDTNVIARSTLFDGQGRPVGTEDVPLVRIRNDAVGLGPFAGALWTPNQRFFGQGFLQCQVPANGDAVFVNSSKGAPRSDIDTKIGSLNDPTFLFLDLGAGYWLQRSHHRHAFIKGVALKTELHWTRSLHSRQAVTGEDYRIGESASTIETLNLTFGTHLELYNNTVVTLAYVAPVVTGADRQFDGEFRLMIDHYFGSSAGPGRVPF